MGMKFRVTEVHKVAGKVSEELYELPTLTADKRKMGAMLRQLRLLAPGQSIREIRHKKESYGEFVVFPNNAPGLTTGTHSLIFQAVPTEWTFSQCELISQNADGAWVKAPDGTQRFYYLLCFDEAGHETLKWLNARGYDCGMLDAIEDASCLGNRDLCAIPEHKAWEINEACYEKPGLEGDFVGFACLNWDSAPGRAIRSFLDAIV